MTVKHRYLLHVEPTQNWNVTSSFSRTLLIFFGFLYFLFEKNGKVNLAKKIESY